MSSRSSPSSASCPGPSSLLHYRAPRASSPREALRGLIEAAAAALLLSNSIRSWLVVEAYAQIMKISDTLMWRYYDLLSFRPLSEIAALRASVEQGANPRDIKFALGQEIVARFHGAAAGEAAQRDFVAQFSQGELPENIPEIELAVPEKGMGLAQILKQAGLVASNTEGNRMIEQKAVRVDQQRVEDKGLALLPGKTYLLQVGSRRYARAVLKLAG
jgi:tyrosyl-tRNA synthetase